MVDRNDDVKLGMKTSAIFFGKYDVLIVMLCYAIHLGGLTFIGQRKFLGPWFYAGIAVASMLALWHYWLIRGRDRALCFSAFRGNHWYGLTIFSGVVIDYGTRLEKWPFWPQ
jgi:4-hydroxybenzoate polyprenyltransferase